MSKTKTIILAGLVIISSSFFLGCDRLIKLPAKPSPFADFIKGHYTQAFKIMSDSMEPDLSEGDRIFFDKTAYKKSDPYLGDIIVFQEPGDLRVHVSRIVGLPGVIIEANGEKIIVPENRYFVRHNRETDVSPKFVTRNDIIGKAAWRFWPLNKSGFINRTSSIGEASE